MTHQEMWAAYRAASPNAGEEYEAWAYGDDPDGLAELTRAGEGLAPPVFPHCSLFFGRSRPLPCGSRWLAAQ